VPKYAASDTRHVLDLEAVEYTVVDHGTGEYASADCGVDDLLLHEAGRLLQVGSYRGALERAVNEYVR